MPLFPVIFMLCACCSVSVLFSPCPPLFGLSFSLSVILSCLLPLLLPCLSVPLSFCLFACCLGQDGKEAILSSCVCQLCRDGRNGKLHAPCPTPHGCMRLSSCYPVSHITTLPFLLWISMGCTHACLYHNCCVQTRAGGEDSPSCILYMPLHFSLAPVSAYLNFLRQEERTDLARHLHVRCFCCVARLSIQRCYSLCAVLSLRLPACSACLLLCGWEGTCSGRTCSRIYY